MFIVQNLNHDRIYIVDEITLTMIDHDGRSMRGDQQDIINKNILATQWIENNVDLTPKQKRILWVFLSTFVQHTITLTASVQKHFVIF